MATKEVKEIVWAFGHPNIQAIHPTTLMFTKDKETSNTGDCIIAVAADKAAADLSQQFKAVLKQNTKLTVTIEADGLREQIRASGSPKLILSHTTDIVLRKSNYICNRTLAIHADKASSDLSRALVQRLKDPKQKIKVTLSIED